MHTLSVSAASEYWLSYPTLINRHPGIGVVSPNIHRTDQFTWFVSHARLLCWVFNQQWFGYWFSETRIVGGVLYDVVSGGGSVCNGHLGSYHCF